MVTGCGARSSVTAPRPTAFVRLEALTARHPLWPEVERLRKATLPSASRTLGRSTTIAATTVAPLTLPQGSSEGFLRAARTRELKGRQRVAVAADAGVYAFVRNEEQEFQRALQQRRAQYSAEESAKVIGATLENRGLADQRIDEQLALLQFDTALSQAALEIATRQSAPDNETLLGTRDPEKIKSEAQKLIDAGAVATFASAPEGRRVVVQWPVGKTPYDPRIRFAAMRLAVDRLAKAMEASGRKVQQDAVAMTAVQVTENQQHKDDETEKRLAAFRLQAEAARNARPLVAPAPLERTATSRTASATPVLVGVPSVRVAAAVPAPTLRGTARWQALAASLRAETLAAVREEAERRGMNLTTRTKQGAVDRTEDFARWIGSTLP